jgi:hypothetical protein
MAKKRPTPQVRTGRTVVRMASPAEATVAVREGLEVLEVQRVALLARRDALVVTLRAEGATWREVERLTGCSRPALLKRMGGAA